MTPAVPFKVLLADADPDTARLLTASLEAAGAEVRRVHRGEDVLAAIREETPDVIATDLVFAGDLDGFAVIDLLKRAGLGTVPVVVLTDYGMAHDAARARALGAVDVLLKSEHAIKEVVATVLARAVRP